MIDCRYVDILLYIHVYIMRSFSSRKHNILRSALIIIRAFILEKGYLCENVEVIIKNKCYLFMKNK